MIVSYIKFTQKGQGTALLLRMCPALKSDILVALFSNLNGIQVALSLMFDPNLFCKYFNTQLKVTLARKTRKYFRRGIF